jgi:DNA-binding transcriptional ArsR family regulator
MMQTNEFYAIQNKKQMAALKAPTRQEILDVLATMGDASIAEIAAALGRPADSLYYHMRILQKVGLVFDAGERMVGTHHEALFRTPSPDMRLTYKIGPKGNAGSVVPIVDAMLRLTSRDFAEAFGGESVVEGDNRELWATRSTGWLTPEHVRKLNRYIARLRGTTVTSRPGTGQLFGLTLVLTPLTRKAPVDKAALSPSNRTARERRSKKRISARNGG